MDVASLYVSALTSVSHFSLVSAERDIVLEVSEEVKREVIADVEEWVCSIERGSSGLF